MLSLMKIQNKVLESKVVHFYVICSVGCAHTVTILQLIGQGVWNNSVWSDYKCNWVALCKPALCDYFVAIFQVAQNRLKFGMSTLFVLKNVPVFFFQECRTIWTKVRQIQPPPPPPPLSLCPSPNNVGFQSLRAKTLKHCACLLRYWWGGGGGVREGRGVGCGKGGGVTFQERVWSLVPACGQKKLQGHFFTEKESAYQISADCQLLGKSLRNSHIGPACTEPFNYGKW